MPRPRREPYTQKTFFLSKSLEARIDNCLQHGALGTRGRPHRSGQFTRLVERLLNEWCSHQERSLNLGQPTADLPSEEDL